MRLLRDVLYRGEFPLLGKKFHLPPTPRKSVAVLGETPGPVIPEHSLNNSKVSIAESNKQEPSTESLHAPRSHTFASLPRAKI